MISAFLIYLFLFGAAGWLICLGLREPQPRLRNRWLWLIWMAVALLFLEKIGYGMWRSLHNGTWLNGLGRDKNEIDFMAYWAAARTAILDNALAVYDWDQLKTTIDRFSARPFASILGFYYPPMFLLLLLPLALFSYVPAMVTWLLVTLLLYLLAAFAIERRVRSLWLTLASPALFMCVCVGQNGALLAALFALALVALRHNRPILSGVLFGLIAIKPQLALLVPLVLIAGRQWKCFAAAAATVAVFAGLSLLSFGWETVPAWLESMSAAQRGLLWEGALGWKKLNSLFGWLNFMGVGGRAPPRQRYTP